MGPGLLSGDLKYGPLFCRGVMVVLQWVYVDQLSMQTTRVGAQKRTKTKHIIGGIPEIICCKIHILFEISIFYLTILYYTILYYTILYYTI